MRTLTVLWCLYELNVCALARRFVGFTQKTSKQSIMMAVLFPNENLKHWGMVFQSSSLSGHLISGDNRTSMMTSQCANTVDTSAGGVRTHLSVLRLTS